MSEREQLLNSILGHPGEDTPRLMLSDWLDECGGCADRARAAFVRLQVERSRLGTEAPTGPDERALFARWGYGWLPDFGGATRAHVRAWNPTAPAALIRTLWGATELVHFERGFPWRYLLAAHGGSVGERFAKRAAALFAVAPVACFELESEDSEPWVEERIGPESGSWRAELHVRAGGPAVGPLDELIAPDRGALSAGFERWVLRALEDICFELSEDPGAPHRRRF